jgi:hypothetical protein
VFSTSTAAVRGWVAVSCGASTTNWNIYLSPGSYGASIGTTRFWGAQIEPGTSATSYVPTTTASVPKNTDVFQPAVPTGIDGAKYCVEGTVTPFGGRAWNTANAAIWGANNGLYSVAGGRAVLFITDGTLRSYAESAGTRTTFTHGWAAGSTHKVGFSESGGLLQLRADGIWAGTSANVSGLTPPITPFRLGTTSSDGNPLDGYLKEFKFFRSPACR